MRRLTILCCLFALAVAADAAGADKSPVTTLRTPAGVEFGLLGKKGAAPAPTALVFATDYETTLLSDDFNKVGRLLAGKGFLCVALDLPCHGKDARPGEAAGIAGWAERIKKGEDVVAAFTKRVSAVLDYLIEQGYTDPKRVVACGTSRGGFIALHVAAVEPRVRSVVAFAPVTVLPALTEFKGLEKHEPTLALSLSRRADRLAGRAVWLCIGNNDERVDTDAAIAFTRKLVAASVAARKPAGKPVPVELHVMPTLGHRIHKTAHDEAAAWLLTSPGGEGK